MEKRLFILFTVLSVSLFGCSDNNSEELTKKEQETIYREEVRTKLNEEESTESSESKETEEVEKSEPEFEPVSEPEENYSGDKFDSLPVGTQASVVSTFYDERATANSLVNGGFFTAYSFDNHNIIIQVTSGVGTGHPIYLLERQGNKYVPADGVVYVGAASVESTTPPQVEVTLAELYEEYKLNEGLYDQTNETSYDMEMTVEDFTSIKNKIGQASESSETQSATPVENEVVGTVNGVTNTVTSFYTFQGSVGVNFSIHNGSSSQIKYSPNEIQLYKDGETLPVNDAGESGVLAPGETGTSHILFDFRGLEPYVLEWNSLQITITPVVP